MQIPRHWGEEITDPMRRLEYVLELLREQRNLHIDRLRQRWDARIRGGHTEFSLNDEDMKEIFNEWRNTPNAWMHPQSLAKLAKLPEVNRHDFIKNRFNAMRFHLIGNAALVDICIRCNPTCAVQPAVLKEFIRRWNQYLETPECQKARDASKKRNPGEPQRFKKIAEVQAKINRGRELYEFVQQDQRNWWWLSQSDRMLFEECRSSALDAELKAAEALPIGPRFRGAASNIMSAGQPNCFNG